jgi:hypothetical protein
MGTLLTLALIAMAQSVPAPDAPIPVAKPVESVVVTAPSVAPKCDARPWQRLVGRTISDLLTIPLPAGTRIYRLDDPPSKSVSTGRLSIEVNRSTRVRRVYCS